MATTIATQEVVPGTKEEARRQLRRLDALVRRGQQFQAKIADALAEAKRTELHRAFGYASLAALSEARYGFGRSKTYDLIAISESAPRLPAISRAFAAGRLHWTKAREIVRVATPEDEEVWLERAQRLSSRQLRLLRKGTPETVRRSVFLTPGDAARFDQLFARVRRRLHASDDGLALLTLLEEAADETETEPDAPSLASCAGQASVPRETGHEQSESESESAGSGVDCAEAAASLQPQGGSVSVCDSSEPAEVRIHARTLPHSEPPGASAGQPDRRRDGTSEHEDARGPARSTTSWPGKQHSSATAVSRQRPESERADSLERVGAALRSLQALSERASHLRALVQAEVNLAKVASELSRGLAA